MAALASNIQGRRFGRLVAIAPTAERTHNKTIVWLCKCDCGVEARVPSAKLKSGETASCGCGEHARSARTPKGESGFRVLLGGYRNGARSRGLPFALSDEEFRALVTSPCAYCGTEPEAVKYGSQGAKREYGKFKHNGVDRVDSRLGYTKENCVPCCTQCNRAKLDYPLDTFLSWVKRVHAHSFR